jgi:hypothetical protein
MFSLTTPPWLVLSVDSKTAAALPAADGYNHHPVKDGQTLVSFASGWTFQVPAKLKAALTGPPLLLVRNKGAITASGGTSQKGYAHQFLRDDGNEPEYLSKLRLFDDKPDDEWLLVPKQVNAVWLQYGYKNQHLSGSSSEIIRYQYGKLIIFRLAIEEDEAPTMNRKADIPGAHDMQYRVRGRQILNTSWSLVDQDTKDHIDTILKERWLDNCANAVNIALSRSGYKE